MRTFLRSKATLLVLALGVLLAVPAVALADTLLADGDGLAEVKNNDMAMGSVACNVAKNQTALLAIRRNGDDGATNTFQNGATVTVSVDSVTGAGLSATIPSGSNTITLPSDWATQPNLTLSDSLSSTVTIDSSVEGAGSGTVTYKATGLNTDGNQITRRHVMNVTWTTGTCTSTNHAPTVSTAALDPSGNEGSQLTTSGAFADQDNDTLTITKLSGAGTVTPSTTTPGAWSWSYTPADNGSGTVVVQASDGNGGTVTDSFDWSAVNVNPTVTLTGPTTGITEGDLKSYSYSWTDPGSADTFPAAGNSVSCGPKGTASNQVFDPATKTGSFDCTFTDDSGTGTFAISATVTDDDNGSDTDTKNASVANANPVVGTLNITDPNGGTACLGGNTVTLGFSFTDAGSADTHKATIAWGDGSTNTVVDPATSPVSGKQHAYSGLGPYTITVTVTDDDNGSGQNTASKSFHYNVGNTLLDPVNADSSSIFKLGSTIPLKVKIADCNGVGVTGLTPGIRMILTSSSTPLTGVDEGTSTQPNDTNWVMRDSGYGQYIYNLASKSLPDSSATYKAVITDHGYSVTTQNYFGLRAK